MTELLKKLCSQERVPLSLVKSKSRKFNIVKFRCAYCFVINKCLKSSQCSEIGIELKRNRTSIYHYYKLLHYDPVIRQYAENVDMKYQKNKNKN